MLHSNNIFELISSDPIQEDEDGILVYKTTDVDQSKIFVTHFLTVKHFQWPKNATEWVMANVKNFYHSKVKCFIWRSGRVFVLSVFQCNLDFNRRIVYLFIGFRMSHLPQMYKSGLFINDFALHDSSRDLVLASTQQSAELKLLLHQVTNSCTFAFTNPSILFRKHKRAEICERTWIDWRKNDGELTSCFIKCCQKVLPINWDMVKVRWHVAKFEKYL